MSLILAMYFPVRTECKLERSLKLDVPMCLLPLSSVVGGDVKIA